MWWQPVPQTWTSGRKTPVTESVIGTSNDAHYCVRRSKSARVRASVCVLWTWVTVVVVVDGKQVVEKIKAVPNETRLLVVDEETDRYFADEGITISSELPGIEHIICPATKPPLTGLFWICILYVYVCHLCKFLSHISKAQYRYIKASCLLISVYISCFFIMLKLQNLSQHSTTYGALKTL